MLKPKYLFNILPKFPPRQDLQGDWSSSERGAGYDFWGLREYRPGDSYGRIDWKAKARTGKLYVREFVKDSAYNLLLLCDVSPSMRFGRKYQMLCDMARSLAHAALRTNNPCGLLMFSDRIEKYVPPNADPRHYYRIADALMNPPRPASRQTSLTPALAFLKVRLKSCLGVILSDFLYEMNDMAHLQGVKGSRCAPHEMVAIHVLEELEHDLGSIGSGEVLLRDSETGQCAAVDLARHREYGLAMDTRLRLTIRTLSNSGIDSVVIGVGSTDVQEKINTFFARRAAARL